MQELDQLPSELIDEIYARIPLRQVITCMRSLSKSHQSHAEHRILSCAYHLSLRLAALDAASMPPVRMVMKRSNNQPAADHITFEGPSYTQNPDLVFVFMGILVCDRMKLCVKENWYTGGAVFSSESAQMGVVISDGIVMSSNNKGSADNLDPSVVKQDAVKFDAAELGVAERHESDFDGIESLTQGFEHSVNLRAALETVAVKTGDSILKTQWDFLFPSQSSDSLPEVKAALRSISIPTDLVLSAFILYRPGLSDLETEDEDSDWEDGDSDASHFGDPFGWHTHDHFDHYDHYDVGLDEDEFDDEYAGSSDYGSDDHY
ncbi:hypothetical protein HDU81_003786 [Chytriomyces hyalinus]|nr:hypothetical protein HDU81_003786 [Chytriomyces hyalinus]